MQIIIPNSYSANVAINGMLYPNNTSYMVVTTCAADLCNVDEHFFLRWLAAIQHSVVIFLAVNIIFQSSKWLASLPHLFSITWSVWDGPTPGARCEVFISHIPRNAYEDQLIPLFSSVGPLWEFRLMMNFSGQNRGFAYAKYGSSAVATQAIHLLHGHMLDPGFRLSVSRSVEKRHLSLGALPTTTKPDELLKVFVL